MQRKGRDVLAQISLPAPGHCIRGQFRPRAEGSGGLCRHPCGRTAVPVLCLSRVTGAFSPEV